MRILDLRPSFPKYKPCTRRYLIWWWTAKHSCQLVHIGLKITIWAFARPQDLSKSKWGFWAIESTHLTFWCCSTKIWEGKSLTCTPIFWGKSPKQRLYLRGVKVRLRLQRSFRGQMSKSTIVQETGNNTMPNFRRIMIKGPRGRNRKTDRMPLVSYHIEVRNLQTGRFRE